MTAATDALLQAAKAVVDAFEHPWSGMFINGKTPQDAALIDLRHALRMLEAENQQ